MSALDLLLLAPLAVVGLGLVVVILFVVVVKMLGE